MVSLSNQVYQLLPDRGYAFQDITVLHSKYLVEQYSDRLVNLAELELASRMLTGAMYQRQEINPAEYVYRSIGTTIRAMNPDEIEVQYLLKYISTGMNTSGKWWKELIFLSFRFSTTKVHKFGMFWEEMDLLMMSFSWGYE